MDTIFSIASAAQLERYAQVIVHCGLGHGRGIEAGDSVLVTYNQGAAHLLVYLQKVITLAGGHLLHDVSYEFPQSQSVQDVLLEHGSKAQLEYNPIAHKRHLYEQANHRITLTCQNDIQPSPQAGTQAASTRRLALGENTELLREFREQHWKSYTLVYLPTCAMAQEAGVSLADYWQVIVDGCYLDATDAVDQVRHNQAQAAHAAAKLSALSITHVRITGPDVDLYFALEETAKFISSNGGNVPSFEVFTAPSASSVSGWIRSQHPTLFEKQRIRDALFTFEAGTCVTATAAEGEAALQRMLLVPGMNRLGEVAMTDKHLSRIQTILPGATLFMENVGGTTHIAFGSAIAKCYQDKRLGSDANQSAQHLDFVCSGECTITAHCADGSAQVIYEDGAYTI